MEAIHAREGIETICPMLRYYIAGEAIHAREGIETLRTFLQSKTLRKIEAIHAREGIETPMVISSFL